MPAAGVPVTLVGLISTVLVNRDECKNTTWDPDWQSLVDDGYMVVYDPPIACEYGAALGDGQAGTVPTHTHPVDGVTGLSLLLDGKQAAVNVGRSFWTKFQTGYNTTVAVAGDSTGNDSNEWVWRLAQFIAPLRPATFVRHRAWSDGTQSYGAPTTIQAGSGAPTCDFYNGSMPGSTLAYHQSRIAVMYPVEPDILFVNSGHNYGTDTPSAYQAAIDAFIAAFRAVWPNTAIVISSQNPEFAPAANAAAHNLRNASLSRYAERNGFGYVATAEGFSDQADGGQILVLADGIHPASAGSDLWRDNAMSFLRSIDVERLGAGSLPLSGGTVTGDVTVSRDAATAVLKVDSDAGQIASFMLSTDGLGRWRVIKDTAAETGSDVGGNFAIQSMTDAGAQKTSVVSIVRSTGAVTVRGQLTLLADGAAQTFIIDTDPGQAANLSWRSNNSERWLLLKTSTAESGSNAGSDLQLLARTDAGASLATAAAFTRSTGQASFTAYPVKVHSAATGSRPTASAAGVGAHMFDTTLNRPIWSTGSAWVDATGATV